MRKSFGPSEQDQLLSGVSDWTEQVKERGIQQYNTNTLDSGGAFAFIASNADNNPSHSHTLADALKFQ